jgi:hypothetical protein
VEPLQYRPPLQLETEVLEWCDAAYAEADQELAESHETKLTAKLIDYIEGRQWSAKARYGRSRPVVNRMFRQFIEMVGLLTDLELDFTVKFFNQINDYSELQQFCNQMILDWIFDGDVETTLQMIVMWGLIHTGPSKVQWNPLLNNGMGDVEIQDLSPLQFMMLGSGRDAFDSEVCIVRRPVTLAWLKRRYGTIAGEIKPDRNLSNVPGQVGRPAKMGKGSWNNLPNSVKRMIGVKGEPVESTVPQVMEQEFWLRDDAKWSGKESIIVGPVDRDGAPMCNWCYRVEPGMPLWPRGRIIVRAGNKVLEDTCNPYWHGQFPFPQYRAFQVPWKVQGLSPLEPIAAMQAILNRINGGVLDTVYGAIERPLMAPKAAFSQGDWDTIDPNQPGVKVPYNNNAPREPRYLEAPSLPAYVDRTQDRVEREMDQTSGASAISQAMAKKQVPGGDSLDMIFNSRSTNIRLMGRGLKNFLIKTGSLVVSNMLQFYSVKHRIQKYGAKGIQAGDMIPWYGHLVPRGMEPEEFVRSVSFTIRRGSVLAIEKQEKTPVVFALRKNKDISRKGVYRFLDANIDVDRNERELKEEMAEAAAIGAAAGAMGGSTTSNYCFCSSNSFIAFQLSKLVLHLPDNKCRVVMVITICFIGDGRTSSIGLAIPRAFSSSS